MVKLTDLIAPAFYGVHQAVKEDLYTHYWLKGGRGSTKSSFVAVEIILGMMQNPDASAVAIRKVGLYLRDSVFEQLLWAIEKLGVSHLWRAKVSPMELIYEPTGQRVLFRGADKPKKLKSTKVSHGYIRYIWYEEVDEFQGQEEIDVINQTLLRGGPTFTVFYSFNPPKSVQSWTNAITSRPDTLIHHSTYLTVPADWLGDPFLVEAEHLMQAKPDRYRHEFLGEVTGTGGEVFANLSLVEIPDASIKGFDRLNRGIDWGYATDPFVYTVNYYDAKHRSLYIFHEYYKVGAKFDEIYQAIASENQDNRRITADNEPRSNAELRDRGLRVNRAKKGPDSRDHGFLWLQNLEHIYIDPVRCPNTAREFAEYEFEKDANGNWRADYPDKNDHCLAGDTIVHTDKGGYKIADLVGTEGLVCCVNENNRPQWGRFFDVRKTRESAPIFEIELEDGGKVCATGDHPVLTQHGWKLVRDLTDQDCLVKIKGLRYEASHA
ncbi:PBSX family phage terminase large subunit [Peptococcus simiae]